MPHMLQVFLWDTRMSKQPRAVLTPPQPTGALTCLQATADGALILAGSKSGEARSDLADLSTACRLKLANYCTRL